MGWGDLAIAAWKKGGVVARGVGAKALFVYSTPCWEPSAGSSVHALSAQPEGRCRRDGEPCGTTTADRVGGREVIVIQDTSELFLGGRRAKANGYGPVGKGGGVRGLLLHAALAIDAGNDALLGLVDAQVWNRDKGKVTARRSRATGNKDSQRWISAAAKAGKALSAARSITVISDRESDIYEHFVRRPANVEFIVRASWDRQIKLTSGEFARLFAFGARLPKVDRFSVTIPAAPGRKERTAELVLRFSPVTLCRPHPSPGPGLPIRSA